VAPEDLLPYTRRQPFVPFRLHLTDGVVYEVHHPDMMVVSRRTVAVGVPAGAGQPFAERVDLLSMLHIVRVEEIQSPAVP
jgi:hypothetical protein